MHSAISSISFESKSIIILFLEKTFSMWDTLKELPAELAKSRLHCVLSGEV